MVKAKNNEPDTRAQSLLEACDRYHRSLLMEKIIQEVRVIAPSLATLGNEASKVIELLEELDAA